MSVLVFGLMRLVPGDPAVTVLGYKATPEAVRALREAFHLDEPLPRQYLAWLGGVARGDFGLDFRQNEPIGRMILDRLPVTIELTLLSMTIAVAVGVPLGVRAAAKPGAVRQATEGFVVAGIAITDFWLGIMLVLLFAGIWQVLPPSGYVPFLKDPVANLRYLILPVLALAFGEAAYILRTTRGAMEEVLGTQYILFLRAKGIAERRIVYRHALRNAAPPIVTVIGIQFGVLLGGAIVIESLFALPGVGRLIVTSIQQRNYVVVQGGVLVVAVLFILVTLATDLIVGWLDPRTEEGAAT
jgi:peptide/nickel transport system permease protein